MYNGKFDWLEFIGYTVYWTIVGCVLIAIGHFLVWPWVLLIVPLVAINIYFRRMLAARYPEILGEE